jgi:5-methylcytosine-specific restriction protein A
VPTRAALPCRRPGCSGLVASSGYCPKCKPQVQKQWDDRRGTAASRGYDSKWAKARKAYLVKHPLCRECERKGRVSAATMVDHIIPHRGDMKLFWDR